MRRVHLASGIVLLCMAWSPWASEMATQYFTAHMAVHMTVVALAAPLLASGLRGTPLGNRLAPLWPSPIPVSVVELIVVWAWHVPALHHAARHSASIFAIEQTSFLLSGLLLWGSVLRRPSRGAAPSAVTSAVADATAAGIVALLLTFAHMTLLGAILSLSPRPLYHHLSTADALVDQQVGGSLMLAMSAVVYTAGGLWLGYRSLRREVWVRSC
jgi:putative membrane protein